MNFIKSLILLKLVLSSTLVMANIVHHNLDVKIKPFQGKLELVDTFAPHTLPKEILIPSEASDIKIYHGNDELQFIQVAQNSSLKIYPTYKDNQSTDATVKISYLYKPKKPDYQRGRMGRNVISSQVKAVIIDKGVYLSPSSVWYPRVSNALEYIDMKVVMPQDWSSMTTGDLLDSTTKNGLKTEVWQSYVPSERIFLIANLFTIGEEIYKGVKLQTYFHPELIEHHETYMTKLKAYMDIYLEQFGSYPYSKFSVVSNFFSTGYGMASYTLLDKNIIPYSFITETSLGHELLHNWWGNSVYVKGPKGNWCEGLTVYMADYLYERMKGDKEGKAYRVTSLRDYNNYVNDTNKFAVRDFVSRFDNASRAIGYGKVFMIFSMLEDLIGKEVLDKALYDFANNYKYKYAGWAELQKTVQSLTAINLDTFFNQWLDRDYNIHLSSVRLNDNQIQVIQSSKLPFDFKLEISFEKNGKTINRVFNISQRIERLSVEFDFDTYRLDPEFKLVRVLSDKENPATLSKVWGKKSIHFLTNIESSLVNKAISRFPTRASKKAQTLTVKELVSKKIEENHFIFLQGSQNELKELIDSHFLFKGFTFSNNILSFPSEYKIDSINLKEKTLVLSEMINGKQLTLIYAEDQNDLINITSKLSHYGKYSYLIFNKDGRKVSGGIY